MGRTTDEGYRGTFNVESGEIVVSDPCYEKDIWCAYKLPALNGQWDAYVPLAPRDRSWGSGKPERLSVWHIDYLGAECDEQLDGVAGVDSGQMCVWDADDYDNSDPRYEDICQGTMDAQGGFAVVMDFGAASSTKYGDGGYPVFVARDEQGRVVGVSVPFE